MKTVSFSSAKLVAPEREEKLSEKNELLNPEYGVVENNKALQKTYSQHKTGNPNEYIE